MKRAIKVAAVFAMGLALVMAVTACGSSSSASSASSASGSESAASSAATEQAAAKLGTQDLLGGSAITKGAKYFEEEMGITTEDINRFDAGRDIITALTSGSVDFGGPFGVVPTVVGLTSGTDYKVIYIECLIRGSEGLVVREGSGIESVADLKGKKVAVTSASSGHYGMLCALQDEGMTIDDIEMIDMNPKDTYAAWQRGDIDAAYTWNPTLINLTHEGGKVILTVEDLLANGHQTINFHVVRTEYAEQHPDQVKAYIKALARGVDLYYDNTDEAFGIISDYLEIDPADAQEQMSDLYVKLADQVSDDAFGSDTAAKVMLEVAEFLKDAGQIQDAKDLQFYKDAIDTSYIEEILAE